MAMIYLVNIPYLSVDPCLRQPLSPKAFWITEVFTAELISAQVRQRTGKQRIARMYLSFTLSVYSCNLNRGPNDRQQMEGLDLT